MKKKKFIISILLILFILILVKTVPPMFSMPKAAWLVLGLVIIMIILWLTEFIPLGITALLPIIYAPLLGIDTIKNVTSNYSNPVIFLFLGGFVLGIAIESYSINNFIINCYVFCINNNL